jgi:hypothetical protein
MQEREESRERAKRRGIEEAQAATVAESEERFKSLTQKVNLAIRERIIKGKDEEFAIDPATFTPIPSEVTATEWNRKEAATFVQAYPDYFPCAENLQAMHAYIDRNAPNIKLVSALQWEAAYKRLDEFGLLKQRPAPVVAPAPKKVNLTISQTEPESVPSGPKTYIGRDWETGKEREFTEREVNRMSSKEFARAFPVAPTITDLFNSMGG